MVPNFTEMLLSEAESLGRRCCWRKRLFRHSYRKRFVRTLPFQWNEGPMAQGRGELISIRRFAHVPEQFRLQLEKAVAAGLRKAGIPEV